MKPLKENKIPVQKRHLPKLPQLLDLDRDSYEPLLSPLLFLFQLLPPPITLDELQPSAMELIVFAPITFWVSRGKLEIPELPFDRPGPVDQLLILEELTALSAERPLEPPDTPPPNPTLPLLLTLFMLTLLAEELPPFPEPVPTELWDEDDGVCGTPVQWLAESSSSPQLPPICAIDIWFHGCCVDELVPMLALDVADDPSMDPFFWRTDDSHISVPELIGQRQVDVSFGLDWGDGGRFHGDSWFIT